MKPQTTILSLEAVGIGVALFGAFATWQFLQAATSLAMAPKALVSEVPIDRSIQVLAPEANPVTVPPEIQPIELAEIARFDPPEASRESRTPPRSEWIDLALVSESELPKLSMPSTEFTVPELSLDQPLDRVMLAEPEPDPKPEPILRVSPKPTPRVTSTPRRVTPRPVAVEPEPKPKKERRVPSIMERRLKPGR